MESDFFDFKFYEWELLTPQSPFLAQPFEDQMEVTTWGEAGLRARKIANSLKNLGLKKGDHVGIISKNCREWIIADIAIVMAGYVSVPFFSNLSGSQLKEVLNLGDVKALFVGKVENWEETSLELPSSLPIIAFPNYKGHSLIKNAIQWSDLLLLNEPIEKVHKPLLSDIWSIIFTSGTTGVPKGVVLDYNAIEASKCSVLELNPTKTDLKGNNRYFSYLPLNHIAERLVVAYNCFRFGGVIYFNETAQTFTKNLKSAAPTTFFAVPRILTKFKQSITLNMPLVLEQAQSQGVKSKQAKKEIQKALGLQDVRALISGAAPLSESLKEWYSGIGLPITNGYGMTENCAISTILLPEISKPGSVGLAQPQVSIKIDPDSNEILMNAPFLMKGYYKRPDLTNETLVEGWLKTGDQGYLDSDGYLFITGRVNDTFKTSKGKFIVPAHIESKFLKCDLFDQICLVGLGCPQPLLLAQLSDLAMLEQRDQITLKLEKILNEVNGSLHNYERLSSIVLVQTPWNVSNGLLTPTLKIKRSAINQVYKDQINKWQDYDHQIIWEA